MDSGPAKDCGWFLFRDFPRLCCNHHEHSEKSDQNQKRQRGCDPQRRRTLTGPRYDEGEAQNEARALADRLTASGEVPQVIVEHIGRLERDREFVIPLKKR